MILDCCTMLASVTSRVSHCCLQKRLLERLQKQVRSTVLFALSSTALTSDRAPQPKCASFKFVSSPYFPSQSQCADRAHIDKFPAGQRHVPRTLGQVSAANNAPNGRPNGRGLPVHISRHQNTEHIVSLTETWLPCLPTGGTATW